MRNAAGLAESNRIAQHKVIELSESLQHEERQSMIFEEVIEQQNIAMNNREQNYDAEWYEIDTVDEQLGASAPNSADTPTPAVITTARVSKIQGFIDGLNAQFPSAMQVAARPTPPEGSRPAAPAPVPITGQVATRLIPQGGSCPAAPVLAHDGNNTLLRSSPDQNYHSPAPASSSRADRKKQRKSENKREKGKQQQQQ